MARQKGIGEMSNVVKVSGTPPAERYISDMAEGEVGYTVPWAYHDGELNKRYTIGPKGGTASMRVKCVARGQYSLKFEKPKYRRPRFRLW